MENNLNFNLSFDAYKLFQTANEISERKGLSVISEISLILALILRDDTSIHRYFLIKAGSVNKLYDTAEQLMDEYSEYLENQTNFKTIEFTDFTPPSHFDLSYASYQVIQRACKIAKDRTNGDSAATFDDFSISLNRTNAVVYNRYERIISMSTENKTSVFTPSKHTVNLVIPKEIAGCITILNNDYSPDEKYCRILGREKETRKLTTILAKKTKRNAVLVGEPGVGKTAIINKLAWEVVTHNAPKVFENSIFLLLDINSIIAGTTYRGDAEKRFEVLVKFIEAHPECILCIDEIHTMLGAGACREGEMDMANALKPLLARGDAQVIGATTEAEYKKYFSNDGALKRRFERVDVPEPKINEISAMIQNQVRYLSESHGVTISQKLIDRIIFLASCFSYETKNPDRTLDLIDKSMALAKLNNCKEVTEEHILENFDVNNEVFENTPYETRKALAYHEVGHFIINYFSPLLTDRNVIAVSIMPGDGYYGINVLDFNSDIVILQSRNYFIQYIAVFLAGRIAEEICSNELSSGARADLEHATSLAENCIVSYGLSEKFTRNRVYIDGKNNPFFTDKVANQANPEVNKLLKEAENYAKELLFQKKKYVDALVEALLEKRMMSIHEIKDLFESIDEKKEVAT